MLHLSSIDITFGLRGINLHNTTKLLCPSSLPMKARVIDISGHLKKTVNNFLIIEGMITIC